MNGVNAPPGYSEKHLICYWSDVSEIIGRNAKIILRKRPFCSVSVHVNLYLQDARIDLLNVMNLIFVIT